MPRARDYQRLRMYRAERDALIPIEHRHPDAANVRRFLHSVVRDPWFVQRFGRINYRLYPCTARRRVAVGWCEQYWTRTRTACMKLPRWAQCDRVILHELCHGLGLPGPAHGRRFCNAYLKLVRHVMGRVAAKRLRRAYKRHRVCYVIRRAQGVVA